jgi:hypothetical protein
LVIGLSIASFADSGDLPLTLSRASGQMIPLAGR